jgi:hypothetical protein
MFFLGFSNFQALLQWVLNPWLFFCWVFSYMSVYHHGETGLMAKFAVKQ